MPATRQSYAQGRSRRAAAVRSALGAAALLVVLAAVMALAACGDEGGDRGGPAPSPDADLHGAPRYVTEPGLRPPVVSVDVRRPRQVPPGFSFVTGGNDDYGETGPLIVDDQGEPVWVHKVPKGFNATTFQVQTYRGEPVLTWWEGPISDLGYGEGTAVIFDSSYQKVAEFDTGRGYRADLHDVLITPEDTALLISYKKVPYDLSPLGGARDGTVLDSVVQEVDIETGEVLLHWDPLEHVPLRESYREVGDGLWDPYHVNSVALTAEGDLLVSARHTWAVYKVDRDDGGVLWTLGGKASDFRLDDGASFAWQHDAREREDGTLSLYDNQAASKEHEADASRGLVLELDEQAMAARVVHEYARPDTLAGSQGNLQNLDDGQVLVGWGSEPWFTLFAEDGATLLEGRFAGSNQSYRAFRQDWVGDPLEPPLVAARRGGGDITVYASWNGATEVATWVVLAGPSPGELAPVTQAARTGFETAVRVDAAGPYYAVRALDEDGAVLADSAAVVAQP